MSAVVAAPSGAPSDSFDIHVDVSLPTHIRNAKTAKVIQLLADDPGLVQQLDNVDFSRALFQVKRSGDPRAGEVFTALLNTDQMKQSKNEEILLSFLLSDYSDIPHTLTAEEATVEVLRARTFEFINSPHAEIVDKQHLKMFYIQCKKNSVPTEGRLETLLGQEEIAKIPRCLYQEKPPASIWNWCSLV